MATSELTRHESLTQPYRAAPVQTGCGPANKRKGESMNPKHRQTLIAAALFCALAFAATGAYAQEINTRIGKIETINGFPTAEAAKKIFD